MWRWVLAVIFTCTLSVPAGAGTIPITGTIRLPNGNLLNGSIRFTLSVSEARDTSANNVIVAQRVTFPVQNGSIRSGSRIVPNDVLSPANTVYTAEYFTAAGTKIGQNNFAIQGASFDISTATPTPLTTSNISFGVFTGLDNVTSKKIEDIRFADQYAGGSSALKLQAANDDLGTTGIVYAPSSMPSGNMNNPSSTTTLVDVRPKTYMTNPVQSALNITDGNSASDWAAINTGGLSRAKLYVGYTDPVGTGPGDAAALFINNAYSGSLASGGTVQNGAATIVQTQAGTDSLTNRAFLNGLETEASIIGAGQLIYDIRALTANVLTGTGAAGTAGTIRTIVGQAPALPATGLHVGEAVGIYAEYPGLSQANQNTLSGSVNTSGTAVTWVSGDKFSDRGMVGNPITINTVVYVVASVTNSTTLVLGSSAGTQTGVAYSMIGTQYALYADGNVRLDAAVGATGAADPNGGGGIILDTSGGGGATNAIVIRDVQTHNGTPTGTYTRKFIRVNNNTLEFYNQAFNSLIASLTDAGLFTSISLKVSDSGTTGFLPLSVVNTNSSGVTRDVGELFLVNATDVGYIKFTSDTSATPASASFNIATRISGTDTNRLSIDAIGNVNVLTGDLTTAGTNRIISQGGTNIVVRCVTAGALPIGALTINAGSCGSTQDTGLRVP